MGGSVWERSILMKGKQFYAQLINTFLWIGDALILVCVFLFVNLSAFLGEQFPDVALFDGQAWWVVKASGLVVILMLVNLFVRRDLKVFARAWLQNYWLVLFLFFSLASLLWTVYLPATLYEISLLFFSSFAAAYFAIRYRLSGSINHITGLAAFCVLTSLYIVFFTNGGIMQNEPFVGSWNGMFWHRNHTGSLMAFFSMIFLVRLLMDRGVSAINRLVFGMFYLLAAWHVFGSRSAAGILIYVLLNMGVAIIYFWLNWRDKLTPKHYYSFITVAATGIIVFITNLGFFFGLLGRTANMTGRTPLWRDLFLNFYLKKPLLGYGYGALWMQESFRLLMQSRHGWKYPVYFADNGFLDILLNLGGVGLGLFLAMFFTALARGARKVRMTGSWKYIFLLLVLLYVALGNLAYSFLLEVDYFVWMLLLIVVFLLRMTEAEALQPNGGFNSTEKKEE